MGVQDWSPTAADNNDADPSIDWSEGQAPSTVNDSARAMMAAVAKYRDDTGGALATGGSSNAYTLTSNSDFGSYVDGTRIHVVANHSNTGAATINVDALGSKKIRKVGASGEAALASGDMIAAGHYILQYDASADTGAGAFILLNPVPISPTDVGATLAAASAKSTPVDADTVPLNDSADSNALKKVTWANVKATLKTYLDTLYQPLATILTNIAALSSTGLISRTGSGTVAVRTVTAGTGIAVSNGDGVSGNPTVAISHLGFQSLTDPNADRIAFWDDSAGAMAWLTVGTGLSISGTTITATDTGGVSPPSSSTFPVGAWAMCESTLGATIDDGSTTSGGNLRLAGANSSGVVTSSSFGIQTGTWRNISGRSITTTVPFGWFVRVS